MADTSHHPSRHSTTHWHTDPWVADQLAVFDPRAAQLVAIVDPWIKDQLILFVPVR
ncbi:hypothetical protein ACWCQN_38925 [Streptomyces sp. NPDC001984]